MTEGGLLTEEVQQRLHAENQQAIDHLRTKIDMLIQQNEAQMLALRMIIGGSVTDTEALLRFHEEQQRFRRYDRRISDAAESIATWTIRMFLIGGIVIAVWGMAAVGIFDAVKALISRS